VGEGPVSKARPLEGSAPSLEANKRRRTCPSFCLRMEKLGRRGPREYQALIGEPQEYPAKCIGLEASQGYRLDIGGRGELKNLGSYSRVSQGLGK